MLGIAATVDACLSQQQQQQLLLRGVLGEHGPGWYDHAAVTDHDSHDRGVCLSAIERGGRWRICPHRATSWSTRA